MIIYSTEAQKQMQPFSASDRANLTTAINDWVNAASAKWQLDKRETKPIPFLTGTRTVVAKLRAGTVNQRDVEIISI